MTMKPTMIFRNILFVCIALTCFVSRAHCQAENENEKKNLLHHVLIVTKPENALAILEGAGKNRRLYTPTRIFLETGLYVVRITKPGYFEQRRIIKIDQANTFTFTLQAKGKNPSPKPATTAVLKKLVVNVVPSDATIKIMNIIPKFRQGIVLPPGRYKLKIQRKGYQTIWRAVDIKKQDVTVSYRLKKIPVDQPKSLSPSIETPQTPEVTREIKKDVTAPVLTIFLPKKKSVTASILTIAGTVDDPSGVSIVRVNGIDAVLDTDGHFEAQVLLKIGENSVTVEAIDVHRNRSEQTVLITRIKSQQKVGQSSRKDQTPPDIQLINPPEKAVTDAKLHLQGVAIDKSGVAIVRINGVEAILDADGQFEATVLLKIGENSVTVEAIDVHRNRSEQTALITRIKSQQKVGQSSKEDQNPPDIQLKNPPEKAVTDAKLHLQGVAIDKSGVAIVRVNGIEAILDADGQFEATVLLKIGENRLSVEAIDVHRNRSEQTLVIHRMKSQQKASHSSKEDQNPPEIQLKTELENEVTVAKLYLQGIAIDKSGVAIVRVNEVEAILDVDGQFEAPVLLKIGGNSIKIEAIDIHSNRSTKEITIVRARRSLKTPETSQKDSTPPVINIIETPQVPVTNAQITIIGEVEDLSGVAMVKVNGREIFFDTNGYFKPTVLLKIGENEINIEAIDVFYNKSVKQVIVDRVVQKVETPLRLPRDTDAPILIISNLPNNPVSQERLTLKGQAIDPSGVAYVHVNGKKAALDKDGNFEISVLIKPGNNILLVEASDIHANKDTQKIEVTRIKSYGKNPKKSDADINYHGFLIGINKYQFLDSLSTPVDDALAMKAVLNTQYRFNTTTLLNEDVTAKNILNQLDKYHKTLNAKDSLLIFFAGHVFYDIRTQAASWLPTDAGASRTHWLSFDKVIQKIQKIPVRHILLIVSSFNKTAPDLNKEFSVNSSPKPVGTALMKAARILIQCQNNRLLQSDEADDQLVSSKPRSVFVNTIVKGLTEIDDKKFTAQKFYANHLEKNLKDYSHMNIKYTILGNSGHDGGDFVFIRGGE